ncbi:MAG TPA: HAD-IB family phosphatase [Gemmatimonadaceae bacterium]|nr:HAD-IB family phosphatase [Gemmatimonadaceae bacterium]
MTQPIQPAFRTLVLDVDSTVSGIEGIDWLAARRGDVIARRVADLTKQAMQGGVPLEQVYGLRLSEIRPRRDDVDALARAYVEALAPGAVESIASMRRAGVQIMLVSGGLRHALLRMALHLGLSPGDVHAVSLQFDTGGAYRGYDAASPLTTADGKRTVVADLNLDGPVLAAGDGATDLVMRDVVDLFVAYTGFVTRTNVVDGADVVASSFAELERIVLSTPDLPLRGAHAVTRRSDHRRPPARSSLSGQDRPNP